MAATGGPPPPPRGFENFSGSNGNSPPEIELLHVTTSSSDALVPSQPNLGRMNFLSAKNSVELHKSTIERKHSLPATFQPEDYERLVIHDGSGPSSLFPTTTVTTHFTRKTRSAGKTVGWADLDGRNIPRESIESNPEEIVERMDVDSDYTNAKSFVSSGANDKVIETENQLNQIKSSATMVSILERNLGSVKVVEDTFEKPEETFAAPRPTGFDNPLPVASERTRSGTFLGLESELPPSLFDMNNYGSVGSHESISLKRETEEHVVNPFDGLVNPKDIPRSMSDAPDGLYYKNNGSSCVTPFNEQMTEVTEVTGYPNMHTPPCREYNNSLHQTSIRQDQNVYGKSYDDDDDILWPDKPALYIPSLNELAVPDPYYVSRTYPVEYHPMIATVFKKDCRTWLWKSARQREARLAEQKQNEDSDKSV